LRPSEESIRDYQNKHTVSGKNSALSSFMTIIAIILISQLLIQITIVTPAHALTRYYNCIARIANKNATLSISNVNNCYNMIFKGALDYYGIKSAPITSDDNFSDYHDISKKPMHNQEAEPQAIVKEQSQDIFG
jgi:hypothetical protein